MKYDVKITGIGDMVEDLLNEGMLIIFNENVPKDLAEISIIHTISELKQNVSIGDILKIGLYEYKVTGVGSIANETLRDLGHCTFKFSDCVIPELPGIINIKGEKPVINIGDSLSIF